MLKSPSENDRRWLARVGLALALVGLAGYFAFVSRRFGSFLFDDTFITLRYARNLALHGFLSFNADGPRVDGYSSPGWTLVLAAFIRLGFEGVHIAAWLSKLCGLLAGFMAYGLARALGASRLWALLAPLACFSSVGWVVWETPGMETPFVAVCNLALVYALSRGRVGDAWRLLAIAVCAIARPESAVLAVAALGVELWQGPRRRPLALCGFLVALFVGRWVYYGYPLPNPFYVKLAGVSSWERGREDLFGFLVAHGVGLAVLGTVSALWIPRARKSAGLTLCAFAAAAYSYARAGGDYIDFYRYYQPFVPLFFALAAVACTRFDARPRLAAIVAVAVGVALVVDGEIHLRPAWRSQTLASAATYARDWQAGANALVRTYPPGTSIAIRPAGIIPYITDFPTIDMLGLNDHDIALHAEILRPLDPGHNKEASSRQVVARRPDVIVGHPSYRAEDLSNQPEGLAPFRQDYRWRCMPAPPLPWLCVYELRNLAKK